MSQEDFLREEEFVFGKHQTSQARIATIEQRAGLSFGPLAALDPFDDEEEGVATPLTDPWQIRFRSGADEGSSEVGSAARSLDRSWRV